MRGGEEEDEVPSNDSELHRTITHLDSLISLSSCIKSFAGKWQPIKISLQNLRSSLTAVDSGENSAFSQLLSAINSTLDEAHVLAGVCAGENFSGGKLLTRSNLDLLSSRLNLHRQTLDEILSKGLLTQKAIVLCKPPKGAHREEMRIYMKDLYSRMKLSDPEMATRALSSLNEVLSEDEKYSRIAAVDFPEVVGLLIQMLESEKIEIQQEASFAVSAIAGFPIYRPLLVLAGAVASLSRVLEIGTSIGKEQAAKALNQLTGNCDNSWSVSAHGGVTALLKICADPRTSGELLSSVCAVLRNLAGVTEIRRFMIEQGAVGCFLKLSESHDEISQIQGMEFLQVLAAEDSDVKDKIMNGGGMASLVQFFDSSSELSCSPKSVETALRAIEALCFSPASSASALIRMGFLHRLLSLLSHGEASVKEAALKRTANLCACSEEANREMGEMGFIPELVRMLKSKSMEAREVAAEALATMVSVQKNQRRFLKEDDGISAIIFLLNSDEKPRTMDFVLSVILAVSGSRGGRKKIVQSGGLERLRKLAEMEMDDAKKIVKKLSSGRLWSLLAGIWS